MVPIMWWNNLQIQYCLVSSAVVAPSLQVGCRRFDPVTRYQFYAWLAQLVERNVANVQVAGSNPVPRTKFLLGICVVVAHQTLTLLVQVRFLYPLPRNGCFFYESRYNSILGDRNEAKENRART